MTENRYRWHQPALIFERSRCPCLGQALAGDLLAPGGDTVLGHVTLVVLVQGKSAELSVDDGLGLGKVVSGWIDESDHGGTGVLHGAVDLLDGVTEGVSAAKDGDLLAGEIQVLDLLDDLVPGGAASSLVGSGVPGWGADDERGVSLQVADVDLTNVGGVGDVSAELLLDPVGSGLGVSRGGAVEESVLGSGSHSHGGSSSAGGLDGEARARETSLGQQASLHLCLQVRLLRCLFRLSTSAASIPSFWRLSGAWVLMRCPH